MKILYKLKSMLLIANAGSYYVISDKGSSYELPEYRPALEALQDELECMDIHLEDRISDMILSERDD